MDTGDWQEVVGVIGVFTLLTTVLTVTIWQLAATWRARALLAREHEYRTLAAEAVSTQEQTARHLAALGTQLRETQTRLDAIERQLAVTD